MERTSSSRTLTDSLLPVLRFRWRTAMPAYSCVAGRAQLTESTVNILGPVALY